MEWKPTEEIKGILWRIAKEKGLLLVGEDDPIFMALVDAYFAGVMG